MPERFVQQTIRAGSLVLTDGFSGYNELPALGYEWLACNHSAGFFGPTNHIENLWSVIKRALRYIYRDLTFNLNDRPRTYPKRIRKPLQQPRFVL